MKPYQASDELIPKPSYIPQKVGIVYSEVKREYFPTHEQYVTEKDALHDAEVVGKYLEQLGCSVIYLPATPQLSQLLVSEKPEMVFNMTGSVRGQEYLASVVPGILEMHQIPYTGAGILGESMGYNKFLLKRLLKAHGVPVPEFQLFPSHASPLSEDFQFPLISKLNEIHGGVEINTAAVSENERQLRERIRWLIETYDQPVLVEEFIVGREITAILLEGKNKKVYLAEKVFDKAGEKFVLATFDDQWLSDSDVGSYHYAKYEDRQLSDLVRKAFDVCKMSDYGKFDIRIDGSGRYYFIDPNSNPAFGPKESLVALSLILDMYGISFVDILRRLIDNTLGTTHADPNSNGVHDHI